MSPTTRSAIPDPGTLRRRVGPSGSDRLLATTAAVSAVGALVAAAVATLRHPLLVGSMALAIVGAVVATSVALTTRHVGHRRLAVAAAAVAVVAILALGLVTVIGGPAAAPLLVVAALLLAGSGLAARRSLVVAPPYRRSFFVLPPSQWVTTAPVLICNPRSGDGKVRESGVLALCEELGIRTVVLEEGDDLAEVADRAATGADALGMAGGDGSLAVVAAVASRHDIPFVVVPTGTRNHLALDLGLDREDPRQALAAFTCGEELTIDRGEVNGRWFLNNVVFGLYAAAIDRQEYRDAKLTTVLAEMPALAEPEGAAYDLSVTLPDGTAWHRPALLVASNGRYLLRPPNVFGRRPSLTTGAVGVVAVRAGASGPAVVASAVVALTGEDTDLVSTWESKQLVVTSEAATVPSGIDGEGVRLEPPIEIACHPRSLTLLVPPGTLPGALRQRRDEPLLPDVERIGELFRTTGDR